MSTSRNGSAGSGARGEDSLTASASKQPIAARVDLADYRRRKYQTGSAERRWRYQNGHPFD